MSELMRPGDTLIVGIPVGHHVPRIEEMKQRFRDLVPGCEIVYISGASGMTIYRPYKPAPDTSWIATGREGDS